MSPWVTMMTRAVRSDARALWCASRQADHRQIIVRDRLIEPCHALRFASDGPGRPPKLRTAAEGGLFQTYGDLCSAHLAIRSSDRPDMVCMPHAAFDPLLHYYRHENFEDDLIWYASEVLLDLGDSIDLAIERASPRDQPGLRCLYAPTRERRAQLVAGMRASMN
jgi:hypothetical protein